jgi:hypothetical protein
MTILGLDLLRLFQDKPYNVLFFLFSNKFLHLFLFNFSSKDLIVYHFLIFELECFSWFHNYHSHALGLTLNNYLRL